MSDINKIVAAIISTARAPGFSNSVSVATRIEDYQECLKALNDLGGQDEPAGPDLNVIKTALIETLDRVLAKK